MKQVRETQAGRAISCHVVLKDGKICATIHVHYSKSGTVTVDVWEKGLVHQGRAGGYGYDKFTAALAGATICGVRMYDHCVSVENLKELPMDVDVSVMGAERANGGPSLYYISGLDRLKCFGFKVERIL